MKILCTDVTRSGLVFSKYHCDCNGENELKQKMEEMNAEDLLGGSSIRQMI